MLQDSHPRSSRGVSGDDPEGGAGSGVLRRRLVTGRLGRLGTPPSRHYDLGARSSLHGSARHLPAVVGRRAPKETEARPREPKTATVELFPEPGGVQCSFGGRNNPLLYRNISIWRTMALYATVLRCSGTFWD